jgi:hypothetical protein
VLDLKVCDPAMGSGAFLVAACRALASRLVKAWARWPETRPTIPADEDEELHARRLVAQRCLYGVDRNPRAVDLARLSLWLATLAKDHEFTFLDHALKGGDSLLGLTPNQIAAANWDESKPSLPLFRQLVRDRIAEAERARAEIQAAADDTMRAIQEARHQHVETRLSPVRTMADAVVSAFFAADKAKPREKARAEVESQISGAPIRLDLLEAKAHGLRAGEFGIAPFHWQLEFPEVFSRANGGFDAMVGNPPFAGKNTIINGNRANYLPWLQALHEGAHGNSDLVAHFFRRTFGLLREGGVAGLIATNTIGQGDTRASGLTYILGHGGSVLRAQRRLKWPGEAAVVVSVVHLIKETAAEPVLDGQPVSRISAYLVEGDFDVSPHALAANSGKAFQGSIVLGIGFTFDDKASAKGEAENLSKMRHLILKNHNNLKIIRKYIGGDEVNSLPNQMGNRHIIDFFDRPLRRNAKLKSWFSSSLEQRTVCMQSGVVPNDYPGEVAEDWPDLIEIVDRRVRPLREKQKRDALRERWWQFAEKRPGLYRAISHIDFVVVRSLTSAHFPTFIRICTNQVLDQTLIVFASDKYSVLTCLTARVHESWTSFFGATLEDRGRYSIADSFRTFPFPTGFETSFVLEQAGQVYHDHRAELMIARDEGLTKTYNRFHDRHETAPDIVRLRELHAAMDAAVLRAYGWDDLVDRAAPEFIEQEADEGKQAKTRLDWPSDFKDEVLARLLALNAERHREEVRAGLVAADDRDLDEDADDADEEMEDA